MEHHLKELSCLFEWLVDKVGVNINKTHGVLLTATIICGVTWLAKRIKASQHRQYLLNRRAQYITKLKLQMEQVERISNLKISAERAAEITSITFEELQSKLQSDELKCVEVLYAYQRIAFKENKRLNFITQPILEAEERARKLDGLPLQSRENLPLFGIPLSVKENFNLTGYCSTVGLSQLIGKKCDTTSALLQSLMDAGAVPFIRTNLPQSMMSMGAHNPIYGQTRNPLDGNRSPGGSSAGEGSAIGAGASLIGLGSDIGGSVRVPAAWCGIAALKPTVGRFSAYNMTAVGSGQTAVRGTPGLLARDVKALVQFTQAISSDFQFNADAKIPRIHFNNEEYMSITPLTIGYSYHWSPVAATESAKTAVTKVIADLASQGHKVIEWDLPQFDDSPNQLLLKIFFADRGSAMLEVLENDDVSYTIQQLVSMFGLTGWIKWRVANTVGHLLPRWVTSRYLLGVNGVADVDEWFQVIAKLERYKELWLDDWRRQGIDVLITPSVPVPAEVITEKGRASGVGSYTYLLSMVNFPAGVVPLSKITAEDEVNDLRCYPDGDLIQRRLKESIKGSAGLPLSVQCVALPFREEMCLRVMNLISKINQ